MSKIVVSAQGDQLESLVDPRFGRAAQFLLVDTETMAVKAIDNSASKTMAQGAGIQAAETVSRSGAEFVLSGFVGPKAFTALSAAGIKVAQGVENMTVLQAVEKFKAGDVKIAAGPNKQGHWA